MSYRALLITMSFILMVGGCSDQADEEKSVPSAKSLHEICALTEQGFREMQDKISGPWPNAEELDEHIDFIDELMEESDAEAANALALMRARFSERDRNSVTPELGALLDGIDAFQKRCESVGSSAFK